MRIALSMSQSLPDIYVRLNPLLLRLMLGLMSTHCRLRRHFEKLGQYFAVSTNGIAQNECVDVFLYIRSFGTRECLLDCIGRTELIRLNLFPCS